MEGRARSKKNSKRTKFPSSSPPNQRPSVENPPLSKRQRVQPHTVLRVPSNCSFGAEPHSEESTSSDHQFDSSCVVVRRSRRLKEQTPSNGQKREKFEEENFAAVNTTKGYQSPSSESKCAAAFIVVYLFPDAHRSLFVGERCFVFAPYAGKVESRGNKSRRTRLAAEDISPVPTLRAG